MSVWDLTDEEKNNMRKAGWSDSAIAYFTKGDYLGPLESADVCHMARTETGMAVRFCIRVSEGRIESAKFTYQGCPAFAAICTAVAEGSLSKTFDEVESTSGADIWEIIGGLPEGHEKDVEFVLGAFRETLTIYRKQKRVTREQHEVYQHICGLTGRQLDDLDSDPCGECPWIQNCENDHVVI